MGTYQDNVTRISKQYMAECVERAKARLEELKRETKEIDAQLEKLPFGHELGKRKCVITDQSMACYDILDNFKELTEDEWFDVMSLLDSYDHIEEWSELNVLLFPVGGIVKRETKALMWNYFG